jgi:hypothetical protein
MRCEALARPAVMVATQQVLALELAVVPRSCPGGCGVRQLHWEVWNIQYLGKAESVRLPTCGFQRGIDMAGQVPTIGDGPHNE